MLEHLGSTNWPCWEGKKGHKVCREGRGWVLGEVGWEAEYDYNTLYEILKELIKTLK